MVSFAESNTCSEATVENQEKTLYAPELILMFLHQNQINRTYSSIWAEKQRREQSLRRSVRVNQVIMDRVSGFSSSETQSRTNIKMLLLPSEGFGLNFDVIETNILNLLVVLGVVIYLGGDVLRSLLNERKQKIFNTLKTANERFVEAEQKLAEAKQKIQIAQAKALEIREQGKVTAKQTTNSFAQRTLEEIQRLEEGKQAILRFEEEKAMGQVRQQVIRLSLARALQLLQTKIDTSVQRRLIDANINALGKL